MLVSDAVMASKRAAGVGGAGKHSLNALVIRLQGTEPHFTGPGGKRSNSVAEELGDN